MKFTAQTVSEISINPSVRNELMDYARQEFDGEVTAHFTRLLSTENRSTGTDSHGAFASSFTVKATSFDNDIQRYQSADGATGSLEAYLKEHNMVLYGPYLAENHANSAEPITVSFDPLDDEKIANMGYQLIPKVRQGNTANHSELDAPFNIDDYELVEVQGIDDQYAYDHPTLFVIIDDGYSDDSPGVPGGGGSTPGAGGTSTSRDIDCELLQDTDIVQLYMRKFRLNGNLRSAPWQRNLLDMWLVTGDDISFDINNTAVVNDNTAKLWKSKQVSKKNGRKKNWLNTDLGALDLNWERTEVNAYLILAYKSGKDGGKVTANVSTIIKPTGGNETTTTLNVEVILSEKFESFYQFPYDRCGTLAVFKTDQGLGLHEGLSILGADKMVFTFDIAIR